MSETVDSARVVVLREGEVRAGGRYVLYWMTASRRSRWSPALEHAVAQAEALSVPLVVLEPLRIGYPWASARVHRFVVEGMADNARAFDRPGVTYLPYVEPAPGAGAGLLAALAGPACLVVTDHWPFFFFPAMQAAACRQLSCRVEAIDGVGLLPLAAATRDFTVAHSFRRFLHKVLPPYLEAPPAAEPLDGLSGRPAPALPEDLLDRWPMAAPALLRGEAEAWSALPVDADPGPVPGEPGGSTGARRRLDAFLDAGLLRYDDRAPELLDQPNSGLSAHLHFGHIGAWEVFDAVARRERWTPDALGEPSGKRHGWWGMSAGAESFLDELVTWREVAQVAAARAGAVGDETPLPGWARQTLAEHSADPRPHVYDLEALRDARTHDALWNACQRQLRQEGRVTNYLRMYWGKKILHWTATPAAAREALFELNNRYALDGRDPSSTLNLLWVLGYFDRAWGPVRPVFGKVRYMTRSGVERKFRVDGYLTRYGAHDPA